MFGVLKLLILFTTYQRLIVRIIIIIIRSVCNHNSGVYS
jgi:hypothetical protein